MLGVFFCLGYLCIVALSPEVVGQSIVVEPFNKSLTRSTCSHPNVIIEGERIVLTAVLNTYQNNFTAFPLNQIQLLHQNTWNICQVNIDQDGCHGQRPDVCGYCDYQDGYKYHLVFNFTASIRDSSSPIYYYCRWIGLPPLTYRYGYVSVYVAGVPYFQTTASYNIRHRVNDITMDTFTVDSNSAALGIRAFITPDIRHNIKWRYGRELLDTTVFSSSISLNVSQWDDHIGDVILIKYNDVCNRNWSVTIPVTDRPRVVCDLPVTSRSNVTGTQLSFSCRLPGSQLLSSPSCYAWYGSVIYKTDGDRFTCLNNMNNYLYRPKQTTDIQSYFGFLVDTQFTNGTEQAPRVVTFSVNGGQSVIVEAGNDIIFDCKVQGNPGTTAKLIGTGRSKLGEFRSSTYVLHYTLTNVECQDSGRYRCQGVGQTGVISNDRENYVDVVVKCPTSLSHNVTRDLKIYFDPGSDIFVAMEVYGYPDPTEFGLQVKNGSTFVEVDKDLYTARFVSLNQSQGLVTLHISNDKMKEENQFVFSFSNGYNSSINLQLEVREQRAELVEKTEESQSPWMYAFIAVMCVFGVALVITLVICFIRKYKQKGEESEFHNVRSGAKESGNRRESEQEYDRYKPHPTVAAKTASKPRQTMIPSSSTSLPSQSRHRNPTFNLSSGAYENPDEVDEVYENIAGGHTNDVPKTSR